MREGERERERSRVRERGDKRKKGGGGAEQRKTREEDRLVWQASPFAKGRKQGCRKMVW